MQKLFLPLLLIIISGTQTKAQQRLFDQEVQLKTCNISIEANSFIATTVVEMEFYNPKDQEVEGQYSFQLNRGQVITDFQLELNGKYREGSIEERWKARQAYSKVVGKRIDPALLQMYGANYYTINIYPIAAKSSRKIKFTITQMMVEENLKLSYSLPLNLKTVTEKFILHIKIDKPASIPYADKGLLEEESFNMNSDEAVLALDVNGIVLNRPIYFAINQFMNKPQFCINKTNTGSRFIMRYYPEVTRYYAAKTKTINVYWDVSLSGKERDLTKELDFLQRYISENGISKTTILLFNHQLQGVIVFNSDKDDFNIIRNYLLTYKYTGATELGILDFSNVLADAVLLFSDGINSIGNAQPKLGTVPVYLIESTYEYYNRYYSYNLNSNIIGNTGGSVIRLYYDVNVKDAVKKTDSSENFLFKYNSANIHLNESFPVKLGGSILLSGIIKQPDNLELVYGNNGAITKSENFFLPDNQNCDETTYMKMKMLKAYDSLIYGDYDYYHWQDMIVFGLTYRVVTPQTSFLVLERIEDYIRYNIAPPKELEAKCAEMNYVYRSEYRIKALKEFTEQESLEQVVKNYNKRITWWNKNEELIDLSRPVIPDVNSSVVTNEAPDKNQVAPLKTEPQPAFATGGNELKEVVVTGAMGIRTTARSTSSNAQVINSEKLNIVRQTDLNNAIAGKAAVQVRSQSAGKLGTSSSVRLRGENGLSDGGTGPIYVIDGTVFTNGSADINVDDIEDITILQGPAAAARFGSEGTNGAIVITSKKGRRGYSYYGYTWGEYKLSSAEDEYYVQEMQNAPEYEIWDTFLELEKKYNTHASFYFEMADFFFEKNRKDKAQELMYNAVELCNGRSEGLKLAAYLYESWNEFDKAINIYKGILSQNGNDLAVKRDLALAYFQNKNFELAVKTYYSIITAAGEDIIDDNVKENALSEMNAILALHKNEFDISYINHNLLKLLPVDLRITAESNYGQLGNCKFIEPDNSLCNIASCNTKNGGRYRGSDYYKNFYYYDNYMSEYAIKNAIFGKYRIKVEAYGNYAYGSSAPKFVRIITFKNFQKENMKVETKLFDLDNQYGVVELDEINW